MSQFAASGKNPPWVRNADINFVSYPAANLSQPTQLTNTLLAQPSANPGGLGGPGVATGPNLGATLLQQQQAVANPAQAYSAAAAAALGLAPVSIVLQQQQAAAQANQNATGLGSLTLQQNASLQVGTVLTQPGVAMSTSLAATQPGIALPTTLASAPVQTVSYPTPRVLQQAPQYQHQQQQPQQPPKQRVFTGGVTKLHDNFGFVDEDVFFQTSTVKGAMPKVGDRVLVEATYNPNMPFKWNATRIQLLPNQLPFVCVQSQVQNQVSQPSPASGMGRPGGTLLPSNSMQTAMVQMSGGGHPPPITSNNMAPNSMQQQTYNQVPPPVHSMSMTSGPVNMNRMGGGTGGQMQPSRRHSPPPMIRRERERDREIRPPREDRRIERERERERHHERDRTPITRKRSRSPRPRSRSPPRRRTRIVPRYMVQIPKISVDLKEANVIELKKRYQNMYIPSDFFQSGFLWIDAFPIHRNFSFDHPCSFQVMQKDVDPIVENTAVLEPADADHLFSAKVMLLAAPPLEEIYRKSCALAEDPSEIRENFVHPTRLLHFLVGLKGKNETMAIGGPWSPSLDGPDPESDPRVLIRTAIRTCKALTNIDLSACTQWYRFAEVYYRRGETSHKGRLVPARVETVVIFLPDVWSGIPTRLEWDALTASYKKQLNKRLRDEVEEMNENQALKTKIKIQTKVVTPFVAELRRELEARVLNSKGLKSQLVARLMKSLKVEAEKEEEEAENQSEMQVDAQDLDDEKTEAADKDEEKRKNEEEEKKQKEERERLALERRYLLPENACIIVHPSRVAKSGKFDCTVMSLSVLLDYRQEDNKEHSFEVSLFAELFNEMTMRDFGFRIYRALVEAPEKKEDEKEKEKKKEPTKKEEKKDEKKDEKHERKDKPSDDANNKKEKKRREESNKDADDKEVDDEDRDEESEDIDADEEDSDERREKETRKGDEKKSKEKCEKKREKTKMVTFDPGLLLSFVYFDQNHCGYLFDKDVEEVLHTLGLNLSRAQVRKLLQKVVSRDTLNYRKLTDKPRLKEEEEKAAAALAEDKMDVEEKNAAKAMWSNEEGIFGNKKLVPIFKMEHSVKVKTEQSDSENATDTSENGANQSGSGSIPSGMVLHKGALVDIDKLIQQLQRSEKARASTEQKVKDMREELDQVKETASNSERSVQKLSSELHDYKKRLQVTDDSLKKAHDCAEKYLHVVQSCHEKTGNLLKDVKNGLNRQKDGGDKVVSEQTLENGNS
uniref:DBC1/CARP1 catalytically inactive NUDIX hydrolase domain-containing protein n=1 Tax=Strigamia maritima TaxID=126957 RepID=T1JF56_STRMM